VNCDVCFGCCCLFLIFSPASPGPPPVSLSNLTLKRHQVQYFDWSKVQRYAQRHPHNFAAVRDWEAYLRECRRFFVIKALVADTDASRLSPSPWVDQAWHALLMWPSDYVVLCDRLLPVAVPERVIDHNPLGGLGDDIPEQRRRYAHTLDVYASLFGTPPAEYWPAGIVVASPANATAVAAPSHPRALPPSDVDEDEHEDDDEDEHEDDDENEDEGMPEPRPVPLRSQAHKPPVAPTSQRGMSMPLIVKTLTGMLSHGMCNCVAPFDKHAHTRARARTHTQM
jgi:hypothetical protein